MATIPGQPKYLEIADDLREKIAEGVYPVGAELPSTAGLMDDYGVSVTSVRAAIRELRTEGLVRGQGGKGVYVLRKPQARSEADVDLSSLAEEVRHLRQAVERLDKRLSTVEKKDR